VTAAIIARYVFVAGDLMATVVFPLNYVLDANYMFLMRKPIADSPFFVGPWPYYILGVEVITLLHLLLMDLFFRVGLRSWLQNLSTTLRIITMSSARSVSFLLDGPTRVRELTDDDRVQRH
jgi:hypothetical protein